MGTSLAVQWLSLRVPTTGGPDLIPGQGSSSHMPKLKNLNAATKTQWKAAVFLWGRTLQPEVFCFPELMGERFLSAPSHKGGDSMPAASLPRRASLWVASFRKSSSRRPSGLFGVKALSVCLFPLRWPLWGLVHPPCVLNRSLDRTIHASKHPMHLNISKVINQANKLLNKIYSVLLFW